MDLLVSCFLVFVSSVVLLYESVCFVVLGGYWFGLLFAWLGFLLFEFLDVV